MYARKKKRIRRQKNALNAAAVLLICICIYSVTRLIITKRQYAQSRESYEDLSQYIRGDDSAGAVPGGDGVPAGMTGLDGEGSEVEIGKYVRLQEIGADFSALSEINSDVVAWIEIPGTLLNYPVAQCSNNSYYLTHLFTEEYNICGCAFLDYRNPSGFSDENSVIYGHRMNDGSMFTCIQYYSDQSYYDRNPTGILYTPYGNYYVEFFSGYVTEAKGDPWKLKFSSEDEFMQWHDRLLERSDFTSDVPFGPSDRVLTLSTCSHAFDNARYVLHGVIRGAA